jgi:hypothetical protein
MATVTVPHPRVRTQSQADTVIVRESKCQDGWYDSGIDLASDRNLDLGDRQRAVPFVPRRDAKRFFVLWVDWQAPHPRDRMPAFETQEERLEWHRVQTQKWISAMGKFAAPKHVFDLPRGLDDSAEFELEAGDMVTRERGLSIVAEHNAALMEGAATGSRLDGWRVLVEFGQRVSGYMYASVDRHGRGRVQENVVFAMRIAVPTSEERARFAK